MNFYKLSLFALLTIPAIALANKVDKVDLTPKSPDMNTELQVKMIFSVPDDKVSCGVTVDWGDGEKQKLRVGNGQQLLPPFSLSHTYSSAGTKNISIKGESVLRGLSSVGPCEVNVSGAIVVQDPVAKAEAEKKIQLEKAEVERKAQIEAERKEFLASPAGKKELETTKKNFAKLIDKPLAYSCTDKTGEILTINQKNNEVTRLVRLSFESPPKANQIIEAVFTSTETISLTNDSNVKTEYKFTDKSLQIYNSAFVVNGVYKSNNNSVPLMNVCEKGSAAGQLFAEEASGVAEKKRQIASQKAQAEAAREAALEAQKKAEMQAQAGKAIKVSKGREWVEGWKKYVTYLNIQSVTDQISISNVVLNRGRCRVSYAVTNRGATNFPVRAQFGDTVKVDLDSPPCDLIEVEITTNLGTTSYSF
jgi:hypothetical protein